MSDSTRDARAQAEYAAMTAALHAAARGVRGANPVVGAALLDAAGTVLHVAHHRGAGHPHAEIEVLRLAREAGTDTRGTTMVVTLEPCHHTGRTGPCSRAVVAAGITRLRYALADPTAAGGGAQWLREHGVDVHPGPLAGAAESLNERWLRARAKNRPFVTLKIAQSLDGRVAAADGTSQWLTGAQTRLLGHDIRSRADAILVGGGTVRADDPTLTARDAMGAARPQQPLRAVLSRQPVPATARVRRGVVVPEVQDPGWAETGRDHRNGVEHGSAHTATLSLSELTGTGEDPATGTTRQPVSALTDATRRGPAHGADGRFVALATHDPHEALASLRELGVAHVLVEGGPTVAAAFVAADLVDELFVHVAPVLLGDGPASLASVGITTIGDAARWRPDHVAAPAVRTVGDDVVWHLRPARAPKN